MGSVLVEMTNHKNVIDMKKLSVLLLLLLSVVGATANDGAYYAQGNQLIPITDSDISVKKEILSVTRKGGIIKVDVYYEFFNPTKPKNLIVGFEAMSPDPYGNYMLDQLPYQPYIKNFNVVMNGEQLTYDVAQVTSTQYDEEKQAYVKPKYYIDGRLLQWTRQQCIDAVGADDFYDTCPFDYVYHFDAYFKEGVNIVQHTYDFVMGEDTEVEWAFSYVLTAANRWANNGIDDFTLNVNMGACESFQIPSYFFESGDEWTINGKGKIISDAESYFYSIPCPLFHVQSGCATFHKTEFHPEGELVVYKPLQWVFWVSCGDPKSCELILEAMREQYYDFESTMFDYREFAKGMNPNQKRIMRNMPFAYQGHVFNDKELRKYFESAQWYIPDPNYKDDMSKMSQKEKEWIQFWSK